ncbi:hypothetical protein NliqN6_1926 [Naganishia liquefaciens]|uniref:Hikeshi-like domain-containing protein n=1 Tax=Naganishia liquefaciens TaxID=104408 RepID=A0A8H3YDN8_9TREE|nr:hypothetical protein NliqN6_1926 [Naganishia liquefaciens]
MFGCIVAGRLVQTNLQQVDQAGTSFVFEIERAHEVNHLTVFLLGTVPFPDGYGASVHFQFPGKDFLPLGTLTNARPSSIYRLRPLQGSAAPPNDAPGRLGIQIQPVAALEQVTASLSSRTAEAQQTASAGAEAGTLVRRGGDMTGADVSRLAEKIVKNLFNYLHSFEGGPSTSLTPETPIPLGVFQRWYERFLSKVRNGGVGWLEEDV